VTSLCFVNVFLSMFLWWRSPSTGRT
jgi:hypothetical protein